MKYILSLFFLSILSIACKKTTTEPPIQRYNRDNPFIITTGSRPLIVAHRGGAGLAPENTILSFDHAVSLGVDIIEMDVCLTKDHVLVTIHDIEIDRTSDGKGKVSKYTFEELQDFNFGYHFQNMDGEYPYRDHLVKIPSLEEVLQRYQNHLLMIEIKESEQPFIAANQLYKLLQKYQLQEKTIVFSVFDNVIQHYRSIAIGKNHTGGAVMEGLTFYAALHGGKDAEMKLRASAFALPNYDNFTEISFIQALQSRNIGMYYWTINDQESMQSLIEKGADGIITDRPDIMKEVLVEMGWD